MSSHNYNISARQRRLELVPSGIRGLLHVDFYSTLTEPKENLLGSIKRQLGMENTFDETALETIELLGARLRRIEYAICGQNEIGTQTDSQTATVRLSELEHSLHQLASKSRVIQELLKLHAKHPDLFQSLPPDTLPTTLDTDTLLSIVLSSASSFPTTASRLTSIRDTPIPPAELSTELINLQPRIAKIAAIQSSQDAEIRELRERSAVLVERWYKRDVLGAGEQWADLEGRIGVVEQKVRRVERARKMDDELV